MSSFLQSTRWEEFQNSYGRKTFRIEKKLVIKYILPLELSYLYCPRPDFKNKEELNKFINEAKKIAQKENSIFLRIEPDINKNFDIKNSLEIGNWKLEISRCIQPQDTLLMDLNHSKETLLKNMHPKTRYNIRLAEKHNIQVEKTTEANKIDIFYNLALKTSARDNFGLHPRAYYKQMLNILGKTKMAELYLAYKENIPTAAILVLFYRDTAIYLHGASDYKYRNLMSPYLLQWQAIQDAKKRGLKTYDFWGIVPENAKNHRWKGITRFKKGFAPKGKIVHYPDCIEIPFHNFLYKVYNLAKKII